MPRRGGVDVRKNDFFRMKARKPSSKSTSKEKKFSLALSKALVVRTRVLGRKLFRSEFVALKRAVRKQCFQQPSDQVSCQLRSLASAVKHLQQSMPLDFSSVSDSLEMMRVQLSVLRQQALDFMLEADQLKETCPHFRHRTLFTAPNILNNVVIEQLGLPAIYYSSKGQLEQLCCRSCLEQREDAYFSWTGSTITFECAHEFEDLIGKRSVSPWAGISPLSIQSIWTQIISGRFRSHFQPPSHTSKLKVRKQ